MVVSKRTSVLALAPVLALLIGAADANAQEAPAEQECRIQVESEVAAVSEGPVSVRAEASQAIGDPTAAEVDEESGIQVVEAAVSPDNPVALLITLNTAEAVPGQWAFWVEGAEGRCSGELTVAEEPSLE